MNEEHFKKITQSLMDFCRARLGYDKDPDVRYLRDEENAKALLGTTANYNPTSKVVSVFVSKRHPKDILRSLAHELVHHDQCCRGELSNSATLGTSRFLFAQALISSSDNSAISG